MSGRSQKPQEFTRACFVRIVLFDRSTKMLVVDRYAGEPFKLSEKRRLAILVVPRSEDVCIFVTSVSMGV